MTLALVVCVGLVWLALAAITALAWGAWLKEQSDADGG